MIFFLFLNENICCGYSLEVPRRGTSNEYPQHMFSLRNTKDIGIFQMKKAPYLLLSLITSFHLDFCASIKIEQILNSYPLTILTGKLFGFLKTLARHCCTASAIWDSWSYPAW